MALPISQYNAFAPQKSSKLRKKELKSEIVSTNDLNQSQESAYGQPNVDESSTQPTIVKTTTRYDELFSSSSSPSAGDHSFENSNNNRI